MVLTSKRAEKQAELYLRYRRVAYGVAKSFSERFNRPYAEMVDEAEHTLARVVVEEWDREHGSHYDPEKCAPQTWIHQCVYWDLKIYCLGLGKSRKKHRSLDATADCHARGSSWIESLADDVGEEGRALLDAILRAFRLLPDDAYRAPVRSRRFILQHLQEEGWDPSNLDAAWQQVAECIPA